MKLKLIFSFAAIAALIAVRIHWSSIFPAPDETLEATEQEDVQVIMVDDNDKDMARAIKNARRTVSDFIQRLKHPQKYDESFSIKKKIQYHGEIEHFWLSNVTYRNGVFAGKIANQPELVKNVQFGDTVKVKETEISDWMWLNRGKMHGGYTLRAMLKYMSLNQADALRAQYQLE